MPIHPSKTKRGTTLCIMLLHTDTGSVWNWWALRRLRGLLNTDTDICMCVWISQYYEFIWSLWFEFTVLEIGGSVKTCSKLSKVQLICNQVHLKDMIVLLNQSLFNKLVLKCWMWVELWLFFTVMEIFPMFVTVIRSSSLCMRMFAHYQACVLRAFISCIPTLCFCPWRNNSSNDKADKP